MRRRWTPSRIIAYILLVGYAVLSLVPFMWAFLVSVTPMSYVNEKGERVGVDIMQWPPRINIFKWPPVFLELQVL